jgi:hypothetical protein
MDIDILILDLKFHGLSNTVQEFKEKKYKTG